MNSIGSKIREYRKRNGMSQLDLELAIDASNGMISRIEADKINPTKETVLRISAALKLNLQEKVHLLGVDEAPITEEDIQKARNLVKQQFDTSQYFLLVDNRWTILDASEGMITVLGVTSSNLLKLMGINILEALFNPELGIRGLIRNEQDFLPNELAYFLAHFSAASNAAWITELFSELQVYPSFNEYLTIAKEIKEPFFDSSGKKQIEIGIGGFSVKLAPQIRQLNADPRFEIVEYYQIL